MALTDTAIKNVKPQEKPYKMADEREYVAQAIQFARNKNPPLIQRG